MVGSRPIFDQSDVALADFALVGFQLLVVGFQLVVIEFQLVAIEFQLFFEVYLSMAKMVLFQICLKISFYRSPRIYPGIFTLLNFQIFQWEFPIHALGFSNR